MSDLKSREDAFEAKFAHDEDLKFKVEARCCKMIGIWAAEKMGISGDDGAEIYAKEVIIANLEEIGLDDVKRKLVKDFTEKNIEFSESEIDEKLVRYMSEAKTQIMEEI